MVYIPLLWGFISFPVHGNLLQSAFYSVAIRFVVHGNRLPFGCCLGFVSPFRIPSVWRLFVRTLRFFGVLRKHNRTLRKPWFCRSGKGCAASVGPGEEITSRRLFIHLFLAPLLYHSLGAVSTHKCNLWENNFLNIHTMTPKTG